MKDSSAIMRIPDFRMVLAACLFATGSAFCSAQTTSPSSTAPSGVPESAPAGVAAPISNVDQLLDRLSEADRSFDTISAKVRYEKVQALLGDTQVRRGTVYLAHNPQTGKRVFHVAFEGIYVDHAYEPQHRDYIFDGRYLVEKLNDQKQFIKREVVKKGESYDPMSVDGPFPLPLGQAKDAILKRFEATMPPIETGADLSKQVNTTDQSGKLLAPLKGDYRLHLRAKAPDDDLDTIDLWYDPHTFLPMRAYILEKSGDSTTVDLRDYELNPKLDFDSLFSTITPQGKDADGWKIDVSEMERNTGNHDDDSVEGGN